MFFRSRNNNININYKKDNTTEIVRTSTPKQPQPQKSRYYMHPGGTITDPLIKDILNSPHTLIGGTTGSGKSTLLDNIIYNILTCCDINNNLILIDPKLIALNKYRKLPQVLKYADNVQDTLNVLNYAIDNMMYRYSIIKDMGLKEYNGSSIYIIIDELADLMTSPQAKEIQNKLQKLLQLSRAAKIHIIACTQSPSRIVIPSTLVLNFTNRVALRCLSPIESRQIINIKGAENLPQYGKCLYMNSTGIKTYNINMVQDAAIQKAIDNWLYNLEIVK